MRLYLKTLAVLVFFILQFVFVLPFCMSSDSWIEFTTGWIIVLIVDPFVIFTFWKNVTKETK